jgi:hypothetical protein
MRYAIPGHYVHEPESTPQIDCLAIFGHTISVAAKGNAVIDDGEGRIIEVLRQEGRTRDQGFFVSARVLECLSSLLTVSRAELHSCRP